MIAPSEEIVRTATRSLPVRARPSSNLLLGGLAAREIGKHAPDVAEAQAGHLPHPDLRPGVGIHTPAVLRQDRDFNWRGALALRDDQVLTNGCRASFAGHWTAADS